MKRFKFLFTLVLLVLILPLTLTACSSFQGEPLPFFQGFGWQDLIGLLFSALLGFFPGFNVFQWLKNKFGWEGQKAHYIVLAFSGVVTFLAMLVTGSFNFTGFEVTLGNLLEFGGMFYAATQVAYQRFKASQPG
jgi:hypothetical protein